MKPVTIWSLSICIVLALAAFVIGVCFDLQKLDVNFLWSAIKNSGALVALIFGLVHYLSARPRIISFRQSDWQVRGENWNDVFVRVPESRHGQGEFPTVEFIRVGGFSIESSGLTYKLEKNGDVLICHAPNAFMPPFKDFTVKITR
jgi:hypothetical protein